jgi:hypothetical protein
VWQASKEPFVALLYDFAVGKSELKPEHTRYLEKLTFDMRRRTDVIWAISLEGRASRTGGEDLNLGLSKVPATKIEVKWVGEELAKQAGEKEHHENMTYRAVLVWVWSADKPKPHVKVTPPVPAKPPSATKEFKIRTTGGRSMSFSLPGHELVSMIQDDIDLEILDVEANLHATYHYTGKGVSFGVGVPIPSPVSGIYYSHGGDWSSFKAPRDWTLGEFEGTASLSAAGVDSGKPGPVNPETGKSTPGSLGLTRFKFSHAEGKHWYSRPKRITINFFDMGDDYTVPNVSAGSSDGLMLMTSKPAPYQTTSKKH